MFVPLTDQLEEQAKRKMEEIEEKARQELDKDNIWNADAKRDHFDPEKEELPAGVPNEDKLPRLHVITYRRNYV